MHNTVLIPLAGLVGLALYRILMVFVVRMQNTGLSWCTSEKSSPSPTDTCPLAKARSLGCQDAPSLPNGGFLGLKHMRMLLNADKDQRFPDMLIERQRLASEAEGREVSTFSTQILGGRVFFTSDPKNIQAMLATQFNDFDLGLRSAIMGPTLGDGIFVQDGKAWAHSRAMLRPNFAREQVSDLEMEERHVHNLLSALPVQQDGWTKFTDIQTLFFRLTLDAATEFLFGESVNSQIAEAQIDEKSSSRQDEKAFSKNFDSAQRHIATKFRFANFHWMYNPKEFKENNKVVHEFAQHYVDLALKKRSAAVEKTAEEGHGDKEKYVFLEALAKQTQDPAELRAQMLNILLAGRDTTASLLSWMMHQLLRNPHVFEKLRSIIVEEFGTYDDPRNISFASLKGCQYLQYCINETLRLWSVVPGNGRRSSKATTLPRGGGPDGLSPVFIPAKTGIDYSIHVMHRRKDLWGEDADEFKPERFIGRRPGFEFLPFNAGPRICVGMQLALTEASYVIVRLLQKFDKIESVPGELKLPVTSALSLTNAPARPVTLRLHEAKA